MKTILSAFKKFGRKDRMRSQSEGCVLDLKAAESPSVINMKPSTPRGRNFSRKENERLSKKVAYYKKTGEFNYEKESKAMEEFSCYNKYSDDEKEWNSGEKDISARIGTEAPKKRYNKFANLFTLSARGRDFSSCTFDRDEGSNLLYISSFGPMENWNMRLQTGTDNLWVGDKLVSINGCVVRSLGALKELLLTHDDAFIEFMFMKVDHSKPSKPYIRHDKWSAVEGPRNQSAKTLTPANSTLSLDLLSPSTTEPGSVYLYDAHLTPEKSATQSADNTGPARYSASRLVDEDIIAPPCDAPFMKESQSQLFSLTKRGSKEMIPPPDLEVDEIPLQRFEVEGSTACRRSPSPGSGSDEKTHELPEYEGVEGARSTTARHRRHMSLDGALSEAAKPRRGVRHPKGRYSQREARRQLRLEHQFGRGRQQQVGARGRRSPIAAAAPGTAVEQPGAAPAQHRIPKILNSSRVAAPSSKKYALQNGVSVRPGASSRPKTQPVRIVQSRHRLRQKEPSPELDEQDIFGDVRSPLGMLRANFFI